MSLICHTPIVIRGYLCAFVAFFDDLTMRNIEKTGVGMSNWWLSEQVFAQWWHPGASSEALDLLHWAMHGVLYRCITMAIKTARKVGVFIHPCVVDCFPDIRGSNTEQIVARWWCPLAFDMALDFLYLATPHELLQCLRMAITMACNGGTFVCCCCLFCLA